MSRIIRFIGIDFGTSTSVVSYMDYTDEGGVLKRVGNLTAVDYSKGQGITAIPTVIKKEDKTSGPESYGCDVSEIIIDKYPDHLYREFKMRLGSNVSREERKQATDLMFKFMAYLAKKYMEYEKSRGDKVDERRIYVSYPAKWEMQQKALTRDAAFEGFKNYGSVRDFDEPTAALFYCLHSDKTISSAKEQLSTVGKVSNILIIDMGAGTTDLVLYRHTPNSNTTILAKYPEPGKNSITFGGREIDQEIYKYLLKEHKDSIKNESEHFILWESKKWKEEFSKALSKNITEFTDRLPFRVKERCDANKIGWLLRDYLPKFPQLVNGIINEAKASHSDFKGAEDIDFVVLTGGHSQWFFIEDMLKGKWVNGLPGNETLGSGINLPKIKNDNWRLIKTTEPQHIVSYGLCLSGIPVSLIHLSNCDVRLEITLGEGYAENKKIISKNTKLPSHFSDTTTYNCKIKREELVIPIKIVPIIGSKGEDRLDPIFVKLPTNGFTDFANDVVDEVTKIFGGEVKKHRRDELDFSITAKFDENMVLSLSGSASTEWFIGGETKSFSLNATDIAKIIKESLK